MTIFVKYSYDISYARQSLNPGFGSVNFFEGFSNLIGILYYNGNIYAISLFLGIIIALFINKRFSSKKDNFILIHPLDKMKILKKRSKKEIIGLNISCIVALVIEFITVYMFEVYRNRIISHREVDYLDFSGNYFNLRSVIFPACVTIITFLICLFIIIMNYLAQKEDIQKEMKEE